MLERTPHVKGGIKMTYADIGDLEIVDDESVPLSAGPEVHCRQVLGETQLRGPLRVRVGQSEDLRGPVVSTRANGSWRTLET